MTRCAIGGVVQDEEAISTDGLVRSALHVGLVVSGLVLAFVLLVRLIPVMAFGYPLVLLLLLLVGPLAATTAPSARSAALAGLVAGAVSALGGALVLAAGTHLLGDVRWSFVAPASSPPMPQLPRPQVVPYLSWPLHYLLVLQPIVAAALAAAYAALFGPQARFAMALERLAAAMPLPVRTKMMALLLVHAALTVAVGWISFSVIEELHLRGHLIQWHTHWLEHVGEIAHGLDAEEQVLGRWLREGTPASEPVLGEARERLAATLGHLRNSPAHPGIWVSRAAVGDTVARYMPFLDRIGHAQAQSGTTNDPAAALAHLVAAREALDQLGEAVARDTARMTSETDLAHHSNLFALLALVFLTVTSGLLLGRVAAQAITRPVGLVAGHLSELASGNFTGRIWAANRDELGALVSKVNEVTAELDRLYREEQRAREAAEALATRERQVAAAKEFLAHTIVHDLKQPIGVLAGYAELLESGRFGPLLPRQAQIVQQLLEAARQLETLANDVVDSFRLEEGVLPLEWTAVRPEDLLRDARASVVSPAVREPELVIDPDTPNVTVDRRLVLRVLNNLIVNAYQHGGASVRVRLAARRLGAGEVLFQIEDDGPGVPPEDRERIFERFVQGTGARSGSGLGLAFVRLAVERHGGRVWVDDSPWGGARFNVALPVHAAAREVAYARG